MSKNKHVLQPRKLQKRCTFGVLGFSMSLVSQKKRMKNWEEKKSVYTNLLKYKGLGKKSVEQICSTLGISVKSTKGEISNRKWDNLKKLLTEIQKQKEKGTYHWSEAREEGRENKNEGFNLIEENLYLFEKKNFQRRISIKSRSAIRLKSGYPVRGQRTRSNAETSRRLNRKRY